MAIAVTNFNLAFIYLIKFSIMLFIYSLTYLLLVLLINLVSIDLIKEDFT